MRRPGIEPGSPSYCENLLGKDLLATWHTDHYTSNAALLESNFIIVK
jgi:hypothetical protein